MSVSFNTPPTHSTIGNWALMVAQTIQGYGVDSQALFAQHEVDLKSLKQNNARIVNAKMNKIWQQGQLLSGDPYIALKLGQQFKPSVFDTLGMSLAVSQDVHHALKRFVRFTKYLNDGLNSFLYDDIDENEVALLLKSNTPNDQEINHHNIEATFSAVVSMLQSIASQPLKVKAVHFRHKFYGDIKPFEDFFACPVYFSSEKNQISFDRHGIFDEYIFSNTSLTDKLDEWLEEYLLKYNDVMVSSKAQEFILTHQAFDNVDQKYVADHLKLSPRMFQRKLKEENISYTKILDTCRQKLAFRLITDIHVSLSELTDILGFSTQSNFSRAFKRWSGCTPHQYRNNKLPKCI